MSASAKTALTLTSTTRAIAKSASVMGATSWIHRKEIMDKYTVSVYETVRREVVVEAENEQQARIIGFETITHDPNNPTLTTTVSGDASISVSKHY